MVVLKRTLPCSSNELPPTYEEKDWWKPIIKELLNPSSATISHLKHFVLIHGTLYHKRSNGVLVRCVCKYEVKKD